jgi:hypothetical protein
VPFPVDAAFIKAAEQKLGLTFPSMFRGRMMKENGGSIEAGDEDWEMFPISDTSDRKRIARTSNDIVRETIKSREWPGFPPAAVAIASNGAGDLLVFLPKDETPAELAPEVYRWSHEGGEIERIADSFADL